MPLYEYECEDCQHRFEVIQKKFSDPPIETCPKCGGPVRKLMSSPAIQFKGSGWYITDYARKDAAGSAGKSDSGASSDGGGAAEKSDKADKGDKADKTGTPGKSDTSATTGSAESGSKATASPKASPDSTK